MSGITAGPAIGPGTAALDATESSPADTAGWRRALDPAGRFAELVALCGFALALPVLDSFAESPETLVYRRVSGSEVLAFALLVTFGLPVVLHLTETGAGLLHRSARDRVHLGVLTTLFGVLGWQLIERHRPDSGLHWTMAVAAAALGGLLVHRFRETRTVLRLVALVPLLVVTSWLALGPVNRVAFADGPGTTQGTHVDNPVPIVMVTFDELPTASLLDDEGRIDATLFPNFARLADESTWFRSHTAVSPTTPEAVPAILTGQWPGDRDDPPTADTHPDNLFRALQAAYDLNVWEATTQLCPPDQCPELGGAVDQGLDALLDDAAALWSDYMREPPPTEQAEFAVRQSNPDAPDQVSRFVTSISESRGGRPTFDFLHTLLPHQPWWLLPSGARHDAPVLAEGLEQPGYHWDTAFFAAAGRQRHLLQLQHTDALLGDLLDRLEAAGRYDESLVVVTADHGVAFTPGAPVRGAAAENVEQVMWTPFFLKEPNQRQGRVDDRPTQAVDILPTIADVIGLEVPWELDGDSALGPPTEPAEELRRVYPWRHNSLDPVEGRDHVVVDGAEAFDRLFDVQPAGSEPRDDLQLYRFGRWGSLVGRQVEPDWITEPGTNRVELLDGEGDPVGPGHFDLDPADEVLPVYLQGDLSEEAATDVLVVVNGFVAGWAESYLDEDRQRFFALTPQQLFAEGPNDIEIHEVSGRPAAPRLRPVPIAWAP